MISLGSGELFDYPCVSKGRTIYNLKQNKLVGIFDDIYCMVYVFIYRVPLIALWLPSMVTLDMMYIMYIIYIYDYFM